MTTRVIRSVLFVALCGAAACGSSADMADDDHDDAPGADGGRDGGGDRPGDKGPCTTAAVVAGNPLYDGSDDPSAADQPLRTAAAPISFHGVAFDGDLMFTATQTELWYADLSAASPVLKRFAGSSTDEDTVVHDGACADARFGIVENLVALPAHGGLVVSDYAGNYLFKVTDPTGPACHVSYYAGGTKARDHVLTSPVQAGDVDGAGATAQFAGPEFLAVDTDGTIYFADLGNEKIKKVAPDASATVSTVASFHKYGTPSAIALQGGKLYLAVSAIPSHHLVEIDLKDGASRSKVDFSRSTFDPLDEGNDLSFNGLASDGTRLFGAGSGLIWQFKDDGAQVHAAGGYTGVQLADRARKDYDLGAPVAARKATLRPGGSTGFTNQWMAFHGDALYWTGNAGGRGSYLEKISCPK
jgi:hypothetical protein